MSGEDIKKLLEGLPNALRRSNQPASKLSKFTGKEDLVEFLRELNDHLSDLGLEDDVKKADCLRRHVDKEAKKELRYVCKNYDKAQYDDLISVLKQRYGCGDEVGVAGAQFYNRSQRPAESMAQFSLALMELWGKVELARNSSMDGNADPDACKDEILMQKFCDGLLDTQTRQDCVRVHLKYKGKSFVDFRNEILKLYPGDDSISSDVRACTGTSKDPMLARMDKLESAFTSLVDSLQSNASVDRAQNEMFDDNGVQDPKGCWNCGLRGHIKAQCSRPLRRFSRGSRYRGRNSYRGSYSRQTSQFDNSRQFGQRYVPRGTGFQVPYNENLSAYAVPFSPNQPPPNLFSHQNMSSQYPAVYYSTEYPPVNYSSAQSNPVAPAPQRPQGADATSFYNTQGAAPYTPAPTTSTLSSSSTEQSRDGHPNSQSRW